MSWTKQQLIEQAFGELALASYIYDLSPEELQAALRRMDAMLATWNAAGIRLGYPLPSSPSGSNLNDESGLPDAAIEAVYLNLAIRTAASKGKQLSQDTRNAAKAAYDVLLMRAAMPPEMQYRSGIPAGAGNKPWRMQNNPFLQPPADPLVAVDGDSTITFD
jgi:hypothetical protein